MKNKDNHANSMLGILHRNALKNDYIFKVDEIIEDCVYNENTGKIYLKTVLLKVNIMKILAKYDVT